MVLVYVRVTHLFAFAGLLAFCFSMCISKRISQGDAMWEKKDEDMRTIDDG